MTDIPQVPSPASKADLVELGEEEDAAGVVDQQAISEAVAAHGLPLEKPKG